MNSLRPHIEKETEAGTSILPVFILGFLTIVTQTIFLRECLSVFQGNELVIGIVLFNWMTLTGVGAFLGRSVSQRWPGGVIPAGSLALLAVLAPTIVYGVTAVRAALFAPGTMLGILEAFSVSALILAPFALVSGCSFTLWTAVGSNQHVGGRIARLYSIESLGSVGGGIVFNVALIFVLSTSQALAALTILTLMAVAVMAFRMRRPSLATVSIVIILLVLGFAAACDVGRMSRALLFPHQRLLELSDTPYGSLSVTGSAEQVNFFENDVLLGTTNDPISAEEGVHYALVQHPHPRKVLLVGGGLSGATQEIMKYGVVRVDWVELNPSVIALARTYTNALIDMRVHPINADARRFIRESAETFDVALINLPDPSTAQLNRYYTVEFLQELRSRLSPGSVVAFSLTSSGDYQSIEARRLYSVLFTTLKSSFLNVLIIPGNRNYFLASDSSLTLRIASLIASRGISTRYVNSDYIDDESMVRRSALLQANLDPSAPVNRDFAPIAYRRQLDYWSSVFAINPMIVAGIMLAAGVAFAMRLNAVNFGMFATGFAATSLECVILLSFQILCGLMYRALGLIVTAFMSGLAVGSSFGRHRPAGAGMGWYAGLQCAIAGLAFLLILALTGLRDFRPDAWIVYAVLGALTFMSGALTGMQFALAARLSMGTTASVVSRLYSIDLVGSALGALLICTFLVPLLGVYGATVAVGILMLTSAGISITARKANELRSVEV